MTDYDFTPAENTPAVPTKEPTVFDQLVATVSHDPDQKPTITLPVPLRSSMTIRYRVNDIDMELLERWRKSNLKNRGSKKEEVDMVRMSKIALVAQCDAILLNGKEAYDGKGDLVTLKTPEFMDKIGALDYFTAVKNVYTRDADIITTFDKLLDAAGYGQEMVEEEDGSDPL